MGQFSRVSGKSLFDFDEASKTMNVSKPLNRNDAICSVARLYESTFDAIERTPTEWDKEFFKSYDEKLNGILNSKTEIVKSDTYISGKTYTGTAYYVSNNVNDDNNGTSPSKPLKILLGCKQ